MTHDPANPLQTLFVTSPEVLAAWSERGTISDEFVALDESDPQRIIDVVTRRRPAVVVIERRFLVTSKGAGLVHRLRRDEDMPRVEIRALSAEHATMLTTAHSPLVTSPASVVALAQPIYGDVRRAVRVPMPGGVHAQVDGVPASLVDLSVLGAQIVSARTLKPNQRVRIQLIDEQGSVVRAVAGIAWSAFELPSGSSPRYRAGLEFREADPASITRFYERVASSAITDPEEPDRG